jgi:CubicO group peptidase (beta-lactamase class C family)
MPKRKRILIGGLLELILFFSCLSQSASAHAAQPSADGSSHELNAADLAQFLDNRIPDRLTKSGVAGAVVLVVKDGKELLSKGYGFADVKNHRPMSVKDTVLRPGSITKLFTWTAVMQMVEQGKLDLDTDINQYLDFKIPEAFGQPITLRHILTHTAGFEDTFKQLATYNPERLVSLETYVKNNLPSRIYPPGKITAYSIYATCLAGYIVERISRQPFTDYVSEHILVPLEMTSSSLAQPLPPALASRMGRAYAISSQSPQPYEFSSAVPAGSLASTADDLSHFMIAHLQNGEWTGKRILKSETMFLMHQHQHSDVPEFNGFTLGFMDQTCNGHRIIGHSGHTLFWHNELDLIPDAGVGFYISINSTGRLGSNFSLLSGLFHEFLGRYFGCSPMDEPTAPTALADASRVAGIYLSSRHPETSFPRLFNLLVAARITVRADGTIENNLIRQADLTPVVWREIGPLLYREQNGFRRMAFLPDRYGHIEEYAIDGDPTAVYMRATAMQVWTPRLLAFSIVVFLLTLIAWPVAFFMKLYRASEEGRGRVTQSGRKVLQMISRLACMLWLLTLTGWTILILKAGFDLTLLSEPIAGRLYLLYTMGSLSAVLTLISVAGVLFHWRVQERKWSQKFADMLLSAALLYVAWFALAFHLLSFKMKF